VTLKPVTQNCDARKGAYASILLSWLRKKPSLGEKFSGQKARKKKLVQKEMYTENTVKILIGKQKNNQPLE